MADNVRNDDDETMTDHFTCPICMEYMDRKILICWSGHSICYRCGRRVDKCPTCKCGLDSNRRNYAMEDAAKLFIKLEGRVNETNLVVSKTTMMRKLPQGFTLCERVTDKTGPYWEHAAGGEVPENAFAGGYDNSSTLYVARAEIEGRLIVGKLLPCYGLAYIPYDGEEREVFAYEVLCNFNGYWMECHGNEIPPNAFVGGQEDGEPLYIGRAQHGHTTLVVGKVKPSHEVLYISYGGREFNYSDYEILCQKTPNNAIHSN